MITKWQGLWPQERNGFYAGRVIKKSEIPKYTRIVLRYNKFYEKDSNRPRFVYCFADSDEYKNKCWPIELDEDSPYKKDGKYYTGDGKRLYTFDEAKEIAEERDRRVTDEIIALSDIVIALNDKGEK